MNIPANDTAWAADCALAEQRKGTVTEIQAERENAKIASDILPGTLAEIDKELEAAEAARLAAVEKKNAAVSIAGQWDALLDRKLAIERELTLGEQRLNNLDIEGRVEFIGAN